jgi:hypothetical protein
MPPPPPAIDCPPTFNNAVEAVPPPSPVAAAPEGEFDWAQLNPLSWGGTVPNQVAERGADWLLPTGQTAKADAATIRRIRFLKDTGAGQNVESLYRILGAPSSVTTDQQTGKPAVVFWETTEAAVIVGVLTDSADSYLAVRVQ